MGPGPYAPPIPTSLILFIHPVYPGNKFNQLYIILTRQSVSVLKVGVPSGSEAFEKDFLYYN